MTALLYILLAIVAFGVMIVIHELGHFLTARAFGVTVHSFSLGMGPRLFGWQGKDGTEYAVRAFPIGGYVSMKGEDEAESGEDSFSEKKPWQKFIIVAAGAVMNILLAMVIILGLALSSSIGNTVVSQFASNAVSDEWLAVGDRILEINGTRVHIADEVAYEILHDGYQPMDILVERGGENLLLEGVPFTTQSADGMLFGGRDFVMMPMKKTVGNIAKHVWFKSLSTVKMIWESLLDLLRGRVGMDAVSGPVGVTEAIGKAASSGAYSLFYLLSILSMNLGVFNLLPLPALDGGRLVFIIIEMLFRRKVPEKFEGAVHFIGIVLLLALMVLVTFKDIVKLFG